MKRKLVQMGKHCLMSAIPKKWLEQHNLKPGDYLNFEEVEEFLIISENPLPKDKSISIRLKKNTNKIGLYRVLDQLYDSGYKTINIEYESSKVLTWIQEGVGLFEEWYLELINNNKCIINSIEIQKEEFKNLFRKTILQTNDLGLVLYKYLNGEKSLIEELRVKHKIVLTNTLSLKRMINTNSLPLEYKYYYFIVIQFEDIANHYEYLLRYLEDMKKIPKEVIKCQEILNNLFEQIYSNFYTFKVEKFMLIHEMPVWKNFEIESNPLLIYHQRAISERIKNIAKYTIGIKL